MFTRKAGQQPITNLCWQVREPCLLAPPQQNKLWLQAFKLLNAKVFLDIF